MRLLFAYLDPGSGSLFLQGAVAIAATAIVSITSFWSYIRSFLGRIFHKKVVSGK